MKKSIFLIVGLMLILSMVACKPKIESTEVATEPAENVATSSLEFAFFIAHTNNEFMSGLAGAVEAAAADAGVGMKVYAADLDPATQVSQIESVIAQGVDGVMIDPASFDGITAAVDELIAAGIPVITFHEPISAQDKVASYVGINLGLIGESTMRQVVEDLNGKGKIAMMYGELGHSAQIAITDGYNRVLAVMPAH